MSRLWPLMQPAAATVTQSRAIAATRSRKSIPRGISEEDLAVEATWAVRRATRVSMQSEEHAFLLRFSVRADIPRAVLADDEFDERAFLDEWEGALKPDV